MANCDVDGSKKKMETFERKDGINGSCSEASIKRTNLKNTNKMENENKCFFSISLENGITITGENPKQVKDFLSDLAVICNQSIKQEDPMHWTEYFTNLRRYFDKAWFTIYNNTK